MSSAGYAAPVDLNTWTSDGAGNWSITSPSSVNQTVNTLGPAALFSPTLGKGYRITGTLRATGSDDDFIGFVLGYTSGAFASSSADYIIIDWRKNNQTYDGGAANAGLRAWRVTNGALGHNGTTWGHASPPFTLLGSGATLGSTSYVTGQTYAFELTFTHDLLELTIDGVTQLSLAGPFPEGGVGLYNYSQVASYTVTDASLLNYTVTAVPGANGTVDTPTQTVDYDESGTVTFTSSPGYQITSITSDCTDGSQSGNSYTADPVRSDCTITPTYDLIPYTVTADPGSNGGVDSPSQVVNYNGTATVTFTPNPGYRVVSISDTCGGGVQTGNSYTVNAVTGDCAISVVYAAIDNTPAAPVPVNGLLSLLTLSGLLLWVTRRKLTKV